jgi:hypothetical protein
MGMYANIGAVFPWTLTELRNMSLDELEKWERLAQERAK